MALTSSVMRDLGTALPSFTLPNVTNVLAKSISQHDALGEKGILVAFICNHCPYVVHIRDVFTTLANSWVDRGLGVVAISANDVENYPQDGPEAMADLAQELGFRFPYLYDETQDVAKAFDAVCTPDFFLFDAAGKLVYRGQFDASRPGNDQAITGSNLSQAVERLLHGQEPLAEQLPSVGCNIKWKTA
ncbi:MAG: thioredoxin family protein [Gammaproteobacteria bacterium]